VWPLAWRVHFFAGILVAPLLAVLCVTGIAYAFAPELDALVYHRELASASPSSAPLSLDAQVEAAARAVPHGTVVSVDPASSPGATTAVNLDLPGRSDPASDTYRTVYVDPGTATVQGVLTTVSGRPPLQQWLREFHGTLRLGTVGGVYSELAASWLPFLATGGLILWFARRRSRSRRGPRRRPRRGRLAGWHALTGIALLAGIAFISVTGLTWSQYAGARFQALVDALHGRTPHLAANTLPYAGSGVGLDRAVGIARRQGLVGPLQVTVPHGSGAYLVGEISQSWPIRQDSVAIDPASGRVIGRLDFAGYPLPAKLTALGIDAHSGTLFGLANQIGLSVFALGTARGHRPRLPHVVAAAPARRPVRPASGAGLLAAPALGRADRRWGGPARALLGPAPARRQPDRLPRRRRPGPPAGDRPGQSQRYETRPRGCPDRDGGIGVTRMRIHGRAAGRTVTGAVPRPVRGGIRCPVAR
jgi:uncharacterized iron-regulated membrane protein